MAAADLTLWFNIATVVFASMALVLALVRTQIAINQSRKNARSIADQRIFQLQDLRSNLLFSMITERHALDYVLKDEDFSTDEYIRTSFAVLMINQAKVSYRNRRQFLRQLTDEDIFKRDMAAIFALKLVRRAWQTARHHHEPDFVAFIDEEVMPLTDDVYRGWLEIAADARPQTA